MNCKSVQTYLSAYLDGELAGPESLQVREHLGCCRECQTEEHQLRSLKSLLRSLPSFQPSAGFEDRLVATVISKREQVSLLSMRFNWRWLGGLAAASVLAVFAVIQATERRVPTSESHSMARMDPADLEMTRDQLFYSGNDPLSGSRFVSFPTHGRD
jgi:anti-sigma factor RsiW